MRAARWTLVVLAVGSLLFFEPWSIAQGEPTAQADLFQSANHADFPAVLQAGFRNWSNGYLITIGAPPFMVPDKPGVILYDRNGAVARQATVWLDGATTVSLTDAAVSSSGTLVVAGGTSNKDGAIANFVAEIGSDDKIHRLVRTTPFVPTYVCALDDGTVWAYGFERNASMTMVENAPRLRQYSFEKGSLQALLDTTALPDAQNSRSTWRLPHGGYLGVINLRCNSKMVVLYNAGTGDLVEFDLRKNALKLTKVTGLPADKTFHITGFALTDSGEIFASFHDASNVKAIVSGLFRLRRDDSGGAKWVAVPGTVGTYLKDSPIHKLWGADGDSLIFSRLRDGRLFWSK